VTVPTQAAFELLAHVRNVGPYEEWLARPRGHAKARLPALVVARRAHPAREDPVALNERLGVASTIAQRVEHQNVVHCFGRFDTEDLTAQLLEALDGIDLAVGLRRSGPIAIPLAVWIARQISEGAAHAHSLGESHRGLNPEHVTVTRQGDVKVDFGLAAQSSAFASSALTNWIDLRYAEPRWLTDPLQHARLDAFGIAAILWELIAGRPFTEARDEARAAYLRTERAPTALEAILEKALGEGVPDARALGDALTRVFYADLDGDDERDGRRALADWVGSVAEAESALFAEHHERVKQEMSRTEIDGDSFEALLAELDTPVRPREFTSDDVDLGSVRSLGGSWAPGMALRTQLQLAIEVQPTEKISPTEPDGPKTEVQTEAPVVSAKDFPRPKKAPSKFLWFWAGFAVTFSLLLLFSAWRSTR
jgi:serine/threonine protein kinase